jgi:hypothetical protein
MRTGRLSISRGHQLEGAPETVSPRLRLVQQPAEAPPKREPAPIPQRAQMLPGSPPVSPDYFAVHDRLTALERLTRLHESQFLSAEEFAAEKALILALPADEILLCEPAPVRPVPAPQQQHGPSLIGRILGWKFLLFSLCVGLAFSYAAQPGATARFLDQSLRAIGV